MNLGLTLALVVVLVMLAISLRAKTPEYSAFISLSLCLLLLGVCMVRIRVITETLSSLAEKIRVESTYLLILLKLIGIAYVSEFAASISKDAGYSAVSAQIELLGKLTMLAVSLPVLLQVVQMVISLL